LNRVVSVRSLIAITLSIDSLTGGLPSGSSDQTCTHPLDLEPCRHHTREDLSCRRIDHPVGWDQTQTLTVGTLGMLAPGAAVTALLAEVSSDARAVAFLVFAVLPAVCSETIHTSHFCSFHAVFASSPATATSS